MRSRAVVRSQDAAGIATRMAKHFGHKVEVETNGDATLIRLPTGECELVPNGAQLEVAVAAEDGAGLARVQEVISSHLVRFARGEAIDVRWNLYECGP